MYMLLSIIFIDWQGLAPEYALLTGCEIVIELIAQWAAVLTGTVRSVVFFTGTPLISIFRTEEFLTVQNLSAEPKRWSDNWTR